MSDEDLPTLPMLDGATSSSEIFVGEEDNDGWIRWRPKIKNEVFDLSVLETNAKIRVHDSIKALLNSWWFGYLQVEFMDYQFEIFPIVPGNYKAAFLERLLGYRNAHQRRLDYIPIGMEIEQNLLLVIRNSTGEVCVEDFEASSYQIICKSLPKFLATAN